MVSGVLTRDNAGIGVRVDAVDVSRLDDAGLDARLRLISRARNQLDGLMAEAVAEKKRRTSPYDTANTLKSELRQSGQQAQRTMRDAEQPLPLGTKAASAVEPNPSGASPTTSSNGNTTAPPNLTTSCSSATTATTRSITATGTSKNTQTPAAPTSNTPGNNPPNPRPDTDK